MFCPVLWKQRFCSSRMAWLALVAAPWVSAQAAEEPALLPLEDLRTFTRVYDQIRNGYVEEISDSQLLEYAIRGMIAELDPHSAYLSKDAFADLQASTSGEFGGVGMEVSLEGGFVKVVTPIDDSPSARAGIQSGDVVVRIDQQAIKGMDLNQAVNLMRGPKGSKISITVMRPGVDQPLEFALERDIIKVQSVRTRVLEDDYFYIRISQFQVGTGIEVLQKLRIHMEKYPFTKGVVLDLRNNPGGVLQSSVEVADAFLDGGMVVYTQGRLANSNLHYNAEAGDLTNGLPLVVLINDGSASASEIVAGALQDHKRAVIMGTRSFGKGSVQTVMPINQDRAIKLTTALYYTPLGRSIQAQGIEPDVQVERVKVTEIAPQQGASEADLARHLNRKDGREIDSKARDAKRITSAQLLREDNQLHEALNLLKGLNIFRQPSPLLESAEADVPEPTEASVAPDLLPADQDTSAR